MEKNDIFTPQSAYVGFQIRRCGMSLVKNVFYYNKKTRAYSCILLDVPTGNSCFGLHIIVTLYNQFLVILTIIIELYYFQTLQDQKLLYIVKLHWCTMNVLW